MIKGLISTDVCSAERRSSAELSAAGAKRGVRSVPMKTVPSRRSTSGSGPSHAKNSMKGLKQPTSMFLQGDGDDVLELFAKNEENKEN